MSGTALNASSRLTSLSADCGSHQPRRLISSRIGSKAKADRMTKSIEETWTSLEVAAAGAGGRHAVVRFGVVEGEEDPTLT